MKPGYFDNKTKSFYNITKSCNGSDEKNQVTIRRYDIKEDKWSVNVWHLEPGDEILNLNYKNMIIQLQKLPPEVTYSKRSVNALRKYRRPEDRPK